MRTLNIMHAYACAIIIAATSWVDKANAGDIEITVTVPMTDRPPYLATELRVTITNRAEPVLWLSGEAFENDAIFGKLPDMQVPDGWAYPQLVITHPDGASTLTDKTILRLESIEPTPIRLLRDESKDWYMLLSIAWDTPERMPIFTEHGEYTITAVAYTADGVVESAPAVVRVVTPSVPAARRAVETLRGMNQQELWGYYEPEYAGLWGEALDEKIPQAVRDLAADAHAHPYREYARLALASAHSAAAVWALVARDRNAAKAQAELELAVQLLENVGEQAPELRARVQTLREEIKKTRSDSRMRH
jgi:hypothetical protein